MAATLDTGSPVDSTGASLHQQSEAADDSPPMRDIGIQEFYELIGMPPPESADERDQRQCGKVENEQAEPQEKKAAQRVFETLEAFITIIESHLKDLGENELEIYQRNSCASTRHPRARSVRPDIAIFRREYSDSWNQGNTFWGSIEMAIEYHSAGKSREERIQQAIAYVGYLLQARPDLVSALGLLVELDSLDFFFCNADGINKLSLSEKEDYLPLLSAVLKYLNGDQKRNLDSTLIRLRGSVLFDVSFPNEGTSPVAPPTTCPSCFLRYSHDPFGRRPNVFIYKPDNNVTAIRVIKDQYIRANRRWDEKEILTKIHANGTYPAVVRMFFFNQISGARCGDQIRVRMGLRDYGTDFLSLETPRDVIYALYDLLEVTRGLYFDHKILHRDISPWNIMIRNPEHTEHIDTCPSTSPVFIRHLLNPREPKHKSSIFLTDFGYDQGLQSSEPRRNGRTGTRMFIARAVQAGQPLPPHEFMVFPGLPVLSEGIKATYESNYPRRVELFNGEFTPQIGPCENPLPIYPFRHKLRHDAESGVWCSFLWGIRASPENEAEVPITEFHWIVLISQYDEPSAGLRKRDNRNMILHDLTRGDKDIFHPGYEGLLSLFKSIGRAILEDYHWAEDSIRRRPDFVHEILQRIILNFVVENKDAAFMDKKKARKNRNGSR